MKDKVYELIYPYSLEQLKDAKIEDLVYITGPLLVMRDAAHKRYKQILEETGKAPFDLNGKIIYYMGPTPKPKNGIIGSCGPTTSKRMDPYVEMVFNNGAFAILGKGARSEKATNDFIKNDKVYLVAIGGAGAYYSKCVKSVKEVAFSDLLAEAVIEIQVEKFPCFLAIDLKGKNLFDKD